MPSDFADAGRRFEAAIQVPELPAYSIRSRSRVKRLQHRWHLIVVCALAVIVAAGSGAVLAAKMSGIRVWLSGNNAAMALHSLATIANPAPEDLRRVVANATFPVVLPVGLPTGTHLNRIIFSPADRPSVIGLFYRDGKNTSGWEFVLVDSSAVERGAIPPLSNGEKLPIATVQHWNAGGETVIMTRPNQFAGQAAIEAAMSRTTPSESFDSTLPMLYRITILGDFSDSVRFANVPDAIAPADGRSVLIGREDLNQIAGLAQERKPLYVIRKRTLDNIPTVAGEPDLGNASTHTDKTVAVSVDGVRAVATVLASKACGIAPRFTCEILFNDRGGRVFRIWALPLHSLATPQKYIVDSRTLKVEREH